MLIFGLSTSARCLGVEMLVLTPVLTNEWADKTETELLEEEGGLAKEAFKLTETPI